MTPATPELKTAAERLLALEVAAARRGPAKLPAATRVTGKFGQVLSPLLGAAGFRALLARALTLATAEAPELGAAQVHADGALDGLSFEVSDSTRFAAGEVVLVAHLIGLLVTFVGEALMLRLVNDMWPKATFDDLDFSKGTNR